MVEVFESRNDEMTLRSEHVSVFTADPFPLPRSETHKSHKSHVFPPHMCFPHVFPPIRRDPIFSVSHLCHAFKRQVVAIKANWGAKSANMRQLADELCLDISSFTLVDDSAAECAEVGLFCVLWTPPPPPPPPHPQKEEPSLKSAHL